LIFELDDLLKMGNYLFRPCILGTPETFIEFVDSYCTLGHDRFCNYKDFFYAYVAFLDQEHATPLTHKIWFPEFLGIYLIGHHTLVGVSLDAWPTHLYVPPDSAL
jgi:hypothetical protein